MIRNAIGKYFWIKNLVHMRLLTCLSITVFSICAVSVSASTWYVNSAANGKNDGTSLADAWKSLGDISWVDLRAGDIVYINGVNGQSYGPLVVNASGNDNSVGGRIWFVGTGNLQPVLGSIREKGADYIGLVNLEIRGTSKIGTGIEIEEQTGWLIQDCYIHSWARAINVEKDSTVDSSYITIRGNTFKNMRAQEGAGEYQITIGGDYHLVEYNTYEHGGDYLNVSCRWSVFRNWYIGPMSNSDLDGIDPHIDVIQFFEFSSSNPLWSEKCIVEGIFSRDTTSDNHHFLQIRDQNLTGKYNGLICRFNVLYNMNSIGENQNFGNERVYNNTFFRTTNPSPNLARWFRDANVTAEDNIYINNSFTRSTSNSERHSPLYTSRGASITAEFNHEYLSGDLQGSNNLENTEPLFTDPASLNFMPKFSSPLNNSERHMALAMNNGSDDIELIVDDSDYFTDGWGIVEGDLIKIGESDWVRILSINYLTETINLAYPRSWNSGDPIFLFGTQVIGALEYRENGYDLHGFITNIDNGHSWEVKVNNPDLCRMVIFYEDGIPQEPDYDAPYIYTSSGGLVNAKVYARFASSVPVIETSANLLPDDPTDLELGSR